MKKTFNCKTCLPLLFLLFLLCPPGLSANPIGKIYKNVNPSVVVIHTVERGRSKTEPNKTATEIGLGSGVVVSSEGLIITAAHVVQVADAVEVKFIDGTIIGAQVVGTVVWADVALLKLDRNPENMVVAEYGDSNAVNVGDQVFVIGAPRNLDHTLTVGYVSGKRSSSIAKSPWAPEYIQTDAAINEGNSGGPMFNYQGKLIGIVSQYITVSGGSEGLGLTTAINVARALLIDRPPFWTGIEFQLLEGTMAGAFNIPQKEGLLVQRIAKASPAHIAGFKPGPIRITTTKGPLMIGGDIILEVDGQKVTNNVIAIEETIQKSPASEPINFKIMRKGQIKHLEMMKK